VPGGVYTSATWKVIVVDYFTHVQLYVLLTVGQSNLVLDMCPLVVLSKVDDFATFKKSRNT